jgi:Uma2 family endonuclease
MSGVTATARMTADEFLALPVDWRGRRSQLIAGEVVMNEPTARHSHGQKTILVALENWARQAPGRGNVYVPLDVKLNERNVYAPDVAWYRAGRAPGFDDLPPYPMPDIAVEVRSPSSWRRDVGVKKPTYERHGAGELWLVDDVAQVVHVLRRSAPGATAFDVAIDVRPGDTLTSPMLPGFELAVDEILGI